MKTSFKIKKSENEIKISKKIEKNSLKITKKNKNSFDIEYVFGKEKEKLKEIDIKQAKSTLEKIKDDVVNFLNSSNKEYEKINQILFELSAQEKLEAELEKEIDKKIRLQAEFDNFRKRILEDTEKQKTSIYADVFADIINIIDNFERALKTSNKNDATQKGYQMIYNEMKNLLEKYNIKEIEDKGIYNESKHQPMMSEDSKDHKSGEIIETLQKGYEINDKVIRPSMVKVAN